MIFFSNKMKSKRIKSVLSRREAAEQHWEIKRLEWSDTPFEATPVDNPSLVPTSGHNRKVFSLRLEWLLTAAALIVLGYFYFGIPQSATSETAAVSSPPSKRIVPVANLATELIGAADFNGRLIVYGKNGAIFTTAAGSRNDAWIKDVSTQIEVLANEERLWTGRDAAGRELLIASNDLNARSIYLFGADKKDKFAADDVQTSIHQSVLITENSLRTDDNWSSPVKLKEKIEDADCWNGNCVVALKRSFLWSEKPPFERENGEWLNIPAPDAGTKREVCVTDANGFVSITDSRRLDYWFKNSDGSWSIESVFSVDSASEKITLLWAMTDLTGEIVALASKSQPNAGPDTIVEVRLQNQNGKWHKTHFSTPLPPQTEIKFVKNFGFTKLLLFTKEGLVYSYK